MSSVANPDAGAPTLLVVKAVIIPDSVASPDNVLVKLRPRQLRSEPSQKPDNAVKKPRRKAKGGVVALDPESPERELVGAMSSKVAQAVLEVISGARSVQQLARWLDARCLSALTTRARLHSEACRAQSRRQSSEGSVENVRPLHHQPLVHSVHCSNIVPGVYETTVVMSDKTRFRAVALRFELQRGLWKVTALHIG